MTDFKNLFEQAQLAEAAYADFTNAGGNAEPKGSASIYFLESMHSLIKPCHAALA